MAGEKRFARFGAKLVDLREALIDRLDDAEILIQNGRHASAIAMGLYALEITLKIAICRRLELEALPVEFQVHDFAGLLVLSGLSNRINVPDRAVIQENWNFLVERYGSAQVNTLRYSRGSVSDQQARDVLRRLNDPTEGVLPWVSAQT